MVFQTQGMVKKAAKTVAAVIKSLGIDPGKSEIKAVEGGAAWQIAKGSAEVMIAINPGQDGSAARLRVVSPIVEFDSDLPVGLAERLLELNGSQLPGIAFGTLGGKVVALVAERGVEYLDRAEVEEILAVIGHYADKYDDLLVDEFGGTRVCDLK